MWRMKIPTTCMPRAGLLLTLTLATAAVGAGTCNNRTLRGWYTGEFTETDSTDADGAIARMNFNGAGC